MPDFSTTYPSFPVLEAQRLRVTGSFLGSFGTVESGGEKHHVAKVLFKCVCVCGCFFVLEAASTNSFS